MRIIRAILPLVLTVIVGYMLNKPLGSIPAFGKLMDPLNGFWANAEPEENDFNQTASFTELQGDASVWFDDRLVPHITANNDHDLYFLQGYLHAYFRLFQMDLQTRAAAGKVSELLGEKALKYDRTQRRKGMIYGAEMSLEAMEREPKTKLALDAYRDGINKYISSLSFSNYPVEYKLMGFEPQPWENINTALLLMYMADDLTGAVDDIAYSYLRKMLGEEFDYLFPDRIEGATPVIPTGTKHPNASLNTPSVPGGNIWGDISMKSTGENEEKGKGSNNWAIGSSKSVTGNAILCNDPHLSLNLPALWYEVQLHAPGINCYGVSLPGAPGIVIGFNDNISWGFTNNYRDVKDYYTIDIADGKYTFDSTTKDFEVRYETIKIKGKEDYTDTVLYTVHGPVMYDDKFAEPHGVAQTLAVKWMGHRASNELLALYKLNRAKGYDDYVDAIGYFTCPAQNFIYADVNKNIALWGQGQYINKWKDQGKYVMNGNTSATLWGEDIPVIENPHAYNPEQGYLSSANQIVTDTAYPYYYNGDFVEYRAWRINEVLDSMNDLTVEDMFALQNDVHSYMAERVLPTMLTALSNQDQSTDEYITELKNWNYELNSESTPATTFQIWWSLFHDAVWKEQLSKLGLKFYPSHERTMELLLDTTSTYQGQIRKAIAASWKSTTDSISKLNDREWYKVKNTSVNHLTKLVPFGYTDIKVGGWGNAVNAMKGAHGPSWRMVVEMADVPNAYGVYPGGQSGHPGSKYYATFIDKWSKGEYYKLSFIANGKQPANDQIKYRWELSPEK